MDDLQDNGEITNDVPTALPITTEIIPKDISAYRLGQNYGEDFLISDEEDESFIDSENPDEDSDFEDYTPQQTGVRNVLMRDGSIHSRPRRSVHAQSHLRAVTQPLLPGGTRTSGTTSRGGRGHRSQLHLKCRKAAYTLASRMRRNENAIDLKRKAMNWLNFSDEELSKATLECPKLRTDNRYEEDAHRFEVHATPDQQQQIQNYLTSPVHLKAVTITNQRATIAQWEADLANAKTELSFLLHHYEKETGLDSGVRLLQEALIEEQTRRMDNHF